MDPFSCFLQNDIRCFNKIWLEKLINTCRKNPNFDKIMLSIEYDDEKENYERQHFYILKNPDESDDKQILNIFNSKNKKALEIQIFFKNSPVYDWNFLNHEQKEDTFVYKLSFPKKDLKKHCFQLSNKYEYNSSKCFQEGSDWVIDWIENKLDKLKSDGFVIYIEDKNNIINKSKAYEISDMNVSIQILNERLNLSINKTKDWKKQIFQYFLKHWKYNKDMSSIPLNIEIELKNGNVSKPFPNKGVIEFSAEGRNWIKDCTTWSYDSYRLTFQYNRFVDIPLFQETGSIIRIISNEKNKMNMNYIENKSDIIVCSENGIERKYHIRKIWKNIGYLVDNKIFTFKPISNDDKNNIYTNPMNNQLHYYVYDIPEHTSIRIDPNDNTKLLFYEINQETKTETENFLKQLNDVTQSESFKITPSPLPNDLIFNILINIIKPKKNKEKLIHLELKQVSSNIIENDDFYQYEIEFEPWKISHLNNIETTTCLDEFHKDCWNLNWVSLLIKSCQSFDEFLEAKIKYIPLNEYKAKEIIIKKYSEIKNFDDNFKNIEIHVYTANRVKEMESFFFNEPAFFDGNKYIYSIFFGSTTSSIKNCWENKNPNDSMLCHQNGSDWIIDWLEKDFQKQFIPNSSYDDTGFLRLKTGNTLKKLQFWAKDTETSKFFITNINFSVQINRGDNRGDISTELLNFSQKNWKDIIYQQFVNDFDLWINPYQLQINISLFFDRELPERKYLSESESLQKWIQNCEEWQILNNLGTYSLTFTFQFHMMNPPNTLRIISNEEKRMNLDFPKHRGDLFIIYDEKGISERYIVTDWVNENEQNEFNCKNLDTNEKCKFVKILQPQNTEIFETFGKSIKWIKLNQ